MIQERLKTAQSRQKSYTDVRKRPLEFEVDNLVYLKVSPMKLSVRYIGPYRIYKRVEAVHTVFHISMSKKC